ncbi:MAG: peroxidase family protein [Actinomycetota bacterium]
MVIRPPSEDTPDSNIPAGYTYLAQFIDHDISSDSRGDRLNRLHQPTGEILVEDIFNERSPFLDLETIYGSEKPLNEGEIARKFLMKEGSLSRLNLGNTFGEGLGESKLKKSYPNDLPRESGNLRAKIVDKRNDSHLLIAQTQVAFIKFHNAIVKYHGNINSKELFEMAREITIRHYQYIVLTDFLPRIVKNLVLETVLKEVSENANKLYQATRDNMYMPLEFSVAAYRTGHSLIRNSYNFNRKFEKDRVRLDELLKLTGRGGGLSDRGGLPSIWTINWNLFFDIKNSKEQTDFNVTKRIDTKLSSFLDFLLTTPLFTINSLAALDLMRGRALGLPTGEEVAKIVAQKTGAKTLDSELIQNKMPEKLREVFKEKTPLWFYLLAEAEIEAEPDSNTEAGKLGEVGSWIVAETFVKLIKESTPSILDEEESSKFFLPEQLNSGQNPIPKDKRKFTMPKMLEFIALQNTDFDEINPIG